jgi:hypothetical protein
MQNNRSFTTMGPFTPPPPSLLLLLHSHTLTLSSCSSFILTFVSHPYLTADDDGIQFVMPRIPGGTASQKALYLQTNNKYVMLNCYIL